MQPASTSEKRSGAWARLSWPRARSRELVLAFAVVLAALPATLLDDWLSGRLDEWLKTTDGWTNQVSILIAALLIGLLTAFAVAILADVLIDQKDVRKQPAPWRMWLHGAFLALLLPTAAATFAKAARDALRQWGWSECWILLAAFFALVFALVLARPVLKRIAGVRAFQRSSGKASKPNEEGLPPELRPQSILIAMSRPHKTHEPPQHVLDRLDEIESILKQSDHLQRERVRQEFHKILPLIKAPEGINLKEYPDADHAYFQTLRSLCQQFGAPTPGEVAPTVTVLVSKSDDANEEKRWALFQGFITRLISVRYSIDTPVVERLGDKEIDILNYEELATAIRLWITKNQAPIEKISIDITSGIKVYSAAAAIVGMQAEVYLAYIPDRNAAMKYPLHYVRLKDAQT